MNSWVSLTIWLRIELCFIRLQLFCYNYTFFIYQEPLKSFWRHSGLRLHCGSFSTLLTKGYKILLKVHGGFPLKQIMFPRIAEILSFVLTGWSPSRLLATSHRDIGKHLFSILKKSNNFYRSVYTQLNL